MIIHEIIILSFYLYINSIQYFNDINHIFTIESDKRSLNAVDNEWHKPLNQPIPWI